MTKGIQVLGMTVYVNGIVTEIHVLRDETGIRPRKIGVEISFIDFTGTVIEGYKVLSLSFDYSQNRSR